MLSGLPEKSEELLKNEVQLTEEEILKELEHYGEEIVIEETEEKDVQYKQYDLMKFLNNMRE